MVTAALKLPPGPRRVLPANPLFGFLAFRRDPLSFLTSLARDYGDIVHFRMGPQHTYLLNHPDLVKDVLVTNQDAFMKGRALQRSKRLLGEGLLTSEGAYHRRQRRLAQPAFHRQRIEAYGATMITYAARAAAQWHDGQTFDVGSLWTGGWAEYSQCTRPGLRMSTYGPAESLGIGRYVPPS